MVTNGTVIHISPSPSFKETLFLILNLVYVLYSHNIINNSSKMFFSEFCS